MISMTRLLEEWNTFFFAPEPAIALGLFRALIGMLCILNAASRLMAVPELYAVDAMVPWRLFKERVGRSRFSLLNWMPVSTASVVIVLGIELFCATTLAVGFCTRISCVGLYLTMTSIHHRNMEILDASDTIIRIFVFLLCLAPAGAAASIDAFWTGATQTESQISPWAFRLIQIQVSLIYVQSVRLKLVGPLWKNGTAAWYPLQLERFVRTPFPRKILGHWLVLRAMTWSVLAMEFAVGTLVWIEEFRGPMICLGLLLHLGFGCLLQLRLFSFVMAAGLLTFLPPAALSNILRF